VVVLMLENALIICNPFNQDALRLVTMIKLESEIERADLELLKTNFSNQEYRNIEVVLAKVYDFSKKYISYVEEYGIEIEGIDFNEVNRLYQNSLFIREEVNYQKVSEIDFEMEKIVFDLRERVRNTLSKIIQLEEKSLMFISNICEKIGFNQELNVSETLKKLNNV
jgi:hypothetical protein